MIDSGLFSYKVILYAIIVLEQFEHCVPQNKGSHRLRASKNVNALQKNAFLRFFVLLS